MFTSLTCKRGSLAASSVVLALHNIHTIPEYGGVGSPVNFFEQIHKYLPQSLPAGCLCVV